MALADLFGESLPPLDPRNRRAADAHKNRNRIITVLCSFALWWAGSLYSDYRAQAITVHKLEIQIAEIHKDVEAQRLDIQQNASLSSEERKAQLVRIERIEEKLDKLGDRLLGVRWFRSNKKEEDPLGGGGSGNGGGTP